MARRRPPPARRPGAPTHAPAAAGAEHGWLPREGVVSEREGADGVPQLWRIGTGSVGAGTVGACLPRDAFPVAVPLLDASHLQIDTARGGGPEADGPGGGRRPRRSSRRCCCGWSATSGRGWCTLHVWDVGQLTGSLPGLYPLTRTGLLTVHDPGNLAGLLDELSDRIRRVHTRVLVGGMPSLRRRRAKTEQAHRAVGRRGARWATGSASRGGSASSSGCCAAGWRAGSPSCSSTCR